MAAELQKALDNKLEGAIDVIGAVLVVGVSFGLTLMPRLGGGCESLQQSRMADSLDVV